MVAPELQKVAARQAGRVLVVKVNTDALADLGERFGIRSIPTLAVFAQGREVARTAGARPAADIEAFVDQAIQVVSPLIRVMFAVTFRGRSCCLRADAGGRRCRCCRQRSSRRPFDLEEATIADLQQRMDSRAGHRAIARREISRAHRRHRSTGPGAPQRHRDQSRRADDRRPARRRTQEPRPARPAARHPDRRSRTTSRPPTA